MPEIVLTNGSRRDKEPSRLRVDSFGGDVRDTPVSPKDVLATAFHLLGIDPHTTVNDLQGRPVPIAGDGQVRPEFFG